MITSFIKTYILGEKTLKYSWPKCNLICHYTLDFFSLWFKIFDLEDYSIPQIWYSTNMIICLAIPIKTNTDFTPFL